MSVVGTVSLEGTVGKLEAVGTVAQFDAMSLPLKNTKKQSWNFSTNVQ